MSESLATGHRAIFQNASMGILISSEEGIIQEVNPFAGRLLGYSEGELIGRKIEVLIPEHLRNRHVEHRRDYNFNPRPRAMGSGMDLLAVKKDGTEFHVEISLAFFEAGGRRRIVSFINDITTRKEMEERLKKLNLELERKVQERTGELSQALLELHHINENLEREMENRNQLEEDMRRALEKEKELGELKSRFVSLASHEFRTPLSGILTSASLIARYRQAADEEKRNRHIQIIKSSVRHLTGILNDFLSLDKLEEGRLECRPSVFSPMEALREVIGDVQHTAKKGQKIHLDCAEGDFRVLMDREMLRNSMLNLLSNAIKYSPEGAEIRVKMELEDPKVILTVQDQGMGIPQAEQKHLFERFFRAHNVAHIPGTGLGLNIVRRYLELMGGDIRFTSREGGGTRFTVTLPRGDAP